MLRHTRSKLGWHYIHPSSGRPLRQTRTHGDPRYINNEAALITGQWGLITADFGMVTTTQMENARLSIIRRLPKGAWNVVTHTEYEESPVIRMAPESRFGGGKNNIHHFAFKFTTGIPLFQIYPLGRQRLSQVEAESLFLAGRMYLPIETRVVPQGRVDEYTVFK